MYIYIHMYVYEPLPDTGRGFAPMAAAAPGTMAAASSAVTCVGDSDWQFWD